MAFTKFTHFWMLVNAVEIRATRKIFACCQRWRQLYGFVVLCWYDRRSWKYTTVSIHAFLKLVVSLRISELLLASIEVWAKLQSLRVHVVLNLHIGCVNIQNPPNLQFGNCLHFVTRWYNVQFLFAQPGWYLQRSSILMTGLAESETVTAIELSTVKRLVYIRF